jgi:hypothetical protein
MVFIGPALIVLGSQLIRRDASVNQSRSRPPIVYLRPFTQEMTSSPGNEPWNKFIERFRLQPMNLVLGVGFLGSLGGVAAGLLQMAGGALAEIGTVWSMIYLPIVWLMIVYAPFWVYRKMRGRIDVSLEKELWHHLRGLGRFVAIGRPGESFAPDGGDRIYLTDDNWQNVVEDWICRARIIIIHLVPGGHTWWEFSQCINTVEPTRILAVVIGQYFTDETYASMRTRIEQEHGISLREQLSSYSLISFKSDRTTCYLQLKRKPWILWPFVAYRLRRATFAPFLANLESKDWKPKPISA